MLDVELFTAGQPQEAAAVFHRDGFVCLKDALTPEQFDQVSAGAGRVMQQQEDACGVEQMNRGYARHSFGSQLHNWEWCLLVDLPTVLPVIEAIWGSEDYTCTGAGGDYSLPGAQIQKLHADIGDFFNDPWGTCTFREPPAPFIVVNFTMVDFTVQNGAIRFIPGTHRTRATIPTLEQEPAWMRTNHLCAPANTAIIRDVRCWHGGTANTSDHKRPMTSVGYHAPWRRAAENKVLPQAHFDRLSARAQHLCRHLVLSEG